MSEYSKVADIEGVRVDYDGNGSIDSKTSTPIEVKVKYYLYEEFVFDPENKDYPQDELEELSEDHEPGDVIGDEYLGGAFARLKYEFEDGVASVKSFKDARSEADGHGDWTAFDFLKVLPVADEVVEEIPDVECVKPAANVLGEVIDEAEEIEIGQR